MVAAVAYVVALAIAIPLVWRLAGLRRRSRRDPTFDPEAASRSVTILGGLAGFAVTGVVLLVSQTSNLASSGSDFTTVLAMFVVAYLGLLSASVQFATVSQKAQAPFDVAAAQYAMATISQYYIYVGWFALRPLFQAFGLSEIADLTSWLLLVANFVGYPLLAAILIRTGYASGRLMVGVAGVGLVVAVLYVAFVRTFVPGGYVEQGTLVLTLLSFLPGAAMYGISAILPVLAMQRPFIRILNERWHLVVLAYTVTVVISVELLLVSVLGLA